MTTLDQDARTERDRHCDGLQALVDLLRAHPELASPFRYAPILNSISHLPDVKGQLAAWTRATAHLHPTKSYDDDGTNFANLNVTFGLDVELQVYASRELVCERRVTGTTEVTKVVKDPEMLKAVPEVEITEQVEQVEWICTPFLAAGEPVAS